MAKKSPLHAGNASLICLGETIRRIRIEHGVSQEALALKAELDRSYVGGIERGEHNLSFMNLIKISESLGVTPSELLNKSSL
jgi:transcriptional regulator with XRE-family HTH domain